MNTTCHPNIPALPLFTVVANNSILKTAQDAERAPLGLMRPPETPGVYILFANTDSKALHPYGPEIISGEFPLYIGSAKHLPDRLSRHRQTIAYAAGLEIKHICASIIPTTSLALALWLERELFTEICPPWNEKSMSGFGSAPQGKTRESQRASGFDCLHHRIWANPTTAKERAAARLALKLYKESGYIRPLWDPLESAQMAAA